jgi:hypothetical protein
MLDAPTFIFKFLSYYLFIPARLKEHRNPKHLTHMASKKSVSSALMEKQNYPAHSLSPKVEHALQ